METVKITRATVNTLKKGDETVIRELKTNKGGSVILFRISTRVNDKASNSPMLFRRCSYFAKNEEEVKKAKELIVKGATIELEGTTNRRSYKDKNTGTNIYYEEIEVKSLLMVQPGETQQVEKEDENSNDLPF